MNLSSSLRYVILLLGVMISGCTNIHWSLSHPIPGSGAEDAVSAAYLDTESSKQWLRVFYSLASDAKSIQLAQLKDIDEQLKKSESPELMLQQAMLYAYGSGVMNTPKALRILEKINATVSVTDTNDTFSKAAVVMLTEIKKKAGKNWLLKQEISQINSRTEETETYVRMLENKLRAIESIEESIHQRKK